MGQENRQGAGSVLGGSEGGDVIQSVVQLLADCLVFHLLSIDLVCRWASRECVGRGRRPSRAEAWGVGKGRRGEERRKSESERK